MHINNNTAYHIVGKCLRPWPVSVYPKPNLPCAFSRSGILGRGMRPGKPTGRVLQSQQVPELGGQQHDGCLSLHEHLQPSIVRGRSVDNVGHPLSTFWISTARLAISWPPPNIDFDPFTSHIVFFTVFQRQACRFCYKKQKQKSFCYHV